MGATDKLDRPVTFGEFNSLKDDMTDMKTLMSRLVETISRISIIEERQHNQIQLSEKVLARLEEVTNRQHQFDISNATNAGLATRVQSLEGVTRDSHVETERNKARFDTVVWMVRGLWAVVGSSGAIWLFHALAATPIPAVK